MNLAAALDQTQTEPASAPTPTPRLALIKSTTPTDAEMLDFTAAVIVNREQLTEAYQSVRAVSGILCNVENLDDLNWQEMTNLCRTTSRAARLLGAMVDCQPQQEGGAR